MATIYKFILETRSDASQSVTISANGEILPLKGAGTKADDVGRLYTGSNVGVEHNRYMRLINPVLNRYTGGWWEKGVRMGRSAIGVVNVARTSGLGAALASVGMIQIGQLAIMELVKWIEREKKKANEENQANYLKLRSGTTMLPKDYKITKNFFGKLTYRAQ